VILPVPVLLELRYDDKYGSISRNTGSVAIVPMFVLYGTNAVAAINVAGRPETSLKIDARLEILSIEMPSIAIVARTKVSSVDSHISVAEPHAFAPFLAEIPTIIPIITHISSIIGFFNGEPATR
jgi:hypothetical protein